MAANFEPVAVALLDVLDGMDTVHSASRVSIGLEAVPDKPFAMVGMAGAVVQAQHNLPSRWTALYKVGFFAKVQEGRNESPESLINAFLVEFQTDMGTDVTLGSVCEHAWISGEVEVIPATRDEPVAACWVSVEVLVLG
jgi:hypothetical protein